MAFLAEVTNTLATPFARSEGNDSDIVINGVAYDSATMLPRVGKSVSYFFDNDSGTGTKSLGVFDVDSVHSVTNGSGDANFYYNHVFSTNHPHVKRSINYARTVATNSHQAGYQYRYDFKGRDWEENPAKHYVYDEANENYIGAHVRQLRYGAYHVWDGSNGMPMGTNLTYYAAPAYLVPNTLYDLTDQGLVCSSYSSSTTYNIEQLSVVKYSSDPELKASATVVSVPSSNQRVNWNYLGKMDNGDLIFNLQVYSTHSIIRYENSTGSLITESSNYHSNAGSIPGMPSQVVRHNNIGENNPAKKVCYLMRANDTTYWEYNTPIKIQMDTATGAISTTVCSRNGGGQTQTPDEYNTTDTTYIYDYWECRIIRSSQDIEGRLGILSFQGHTGAHNVSTAVSFEDVNLERMVMTGYISESDDTRYYAVRSYQWEDILTNSARNTHVAHTVPWCIAPLNPEHTLMMVFCQYSTHVLKYDMTSHTLSEVWFDDNMIITDVTWLPTGKVLTAEHDPRYIENGDIIDGGRMRVQVWSEDMIYNLNITPASNYVAYSGSDISTTVDFSTYNANNDFVSTTLKVEISGPAIFDNGSSVKDVVTLNTGVKTENVTIQGDGNIEFRVSEVQSI